MALSVDPQTFVITIPKADLTLVQASPTEIRELNLNDFRLELKAWEDDQEGGIYLYKTHTHNTETTLGGLTYARVIEILEPYTVTFEDGQYAVNLVGANSNVGDRVNVNQVSVRSANSAGLITSAGIEALEYDGKVTIDVLNVTGNATIGTVYPRGTLRIPSSNIPDALAIAGFKGYREAKFISNATITGDFDDFTIYGFSHVHTNLTLAVSASFVNTRITAATITGTLDGSNEVSACVIDDLAYVNGHIHDCGLIGKITLGGSEDAYFANCKQVDIDLTPEIDIAGSGQNLVMTDYSGLIEISNMTGAGVELGIGLSAGQIILKNTVTAGSVHASGIGKLVDESGNDIPTGTWNGVTIINELLSPEHIADHVWDEDTTEHTTADSTGEKLNKIDRDVGDAQGLILSQ